MKLSIMLILWLSSQAYCGRIQISVSDIVPFKQSFDGASCTDIGVALFSVPGVQAVSAEAVNDGSGRCYSCGLYSSTACRGEFQFIGCGSAVPLSNRLRRPASFRCDLPCFHTCNNAQQTLIG